ncbi:endospore coat-associated protein YheD [Pullulanibacillus camelliae]|uniref:Endospore coat-associated protein YheD n=1 Tax=Pullulanibacillus camelliae TaxID=1707096 RepID=A0A8J2YI21_9BACL|nr:YheC/YheD family protein [Pullulanibacillus camelliae]GGE44316.1 endospore coat-associated protein YheD [Pullulanibacillus camelliae]
MDLFKVEKLNHKPNTVYLPTALYQKSLSKLCFSNKYVNCVFKPTSQPKCYVSEEVWKRLGLPYNQKWHFLQQEDTLHFMPIIGIFTTHYHPNAILPFGQRTEEMKGLLEYARQAGGCAFVFTPRQIQWELGTLTGLLYDEGDWREQEVPFPHVVYDRTPNRRAENKQSVKYVKSQFHHNYGIPWFNPSFFNKWDIHQFLKAHPLSSQFLPQTYDFTSKHLKEALDYFNTVYVKPKKSSHGLGIKRIIKHGEGYICETNTPERCVKHQYASLKDCLISEFHSHLASQYVIQQGIDLQKHNKHPFDFRVHTNKDGEGKWHLSAIAAKVAAVNTITTHTYYGGQILALNDIFDQETAQKYVKGLKEDVVAISEALDEQTDDLIGELGFDLGLDQENRLWLFEINARPGQVIFHHPKIRHQTKLIHRYWFNYCLYLSKLSLLKPLTLSSVE